MSNQTNDDLKDKAFEIAESRLGDEATDYDVESLAHEIYIDLMDKEAPEPEPNPDYHKDGEGLTELQEHNFREQMIKEMYSRLYSFNLKNDKVRSKIDKLSMFFGHLGGTSNLSNQEIGFICHLLNLMEMEHYKFEF